MPGFMDYEDALIIAPASNSLLMGNGFSTAQVDNFVYANLLEVTGMPDNDSRLQCKFQ